VVGKVARWKESALCATAVCSESVYSWLEKSWFPVLKEVFTAVTGYIVNHSSSDIFDDTVTFPDPENVDFDVLHFILLTFWINFNMHYCVCRFPLRSRSAHMLWA